jgi:cellulose synthase/poly-beta-1,6-N-acetylglucosamine synthase-like glycosyltransferase
VADFPRVSIVLPVRNRGDLLRRCLDKLVAQDYPKELTEIIVVDNDSSDDTGAVAAQYDVTLLSESSMHSSYAARNRGIAHSTGEIVAFLDSDCIPATDWLTNLVAPFTDARVGAVVGMIEDAPPESICQEFTARVHPFARPLQNGLKTMLTANAAVRRSALDAVGLFDECLPTAGDVDLGWRIQRNLQLDVAESMNAKVLHVHRSRFSDVFAQYRRYGTSEILLGTLHGGGGGGHSRSGQLRQMLRQLRAIGTYLLSFSWRLMTSPFRRDRRRLLLWPLFLLTVESGNLTGKVSSLIATSFYRRNPYANPRRSSAGLLPSGRS